MSAPALLSPAGVVGMPDLLVGRRPGSAKAFPSGVASDVPSRWVEVVAERDIIAAVREAREHGGQVRAVGSGGSKNDCFRTTGTALRFDRYDRVLALAGDAVTVQAGATVGALNDALRRHGLALPTHGEWAGATVAGAVATGTHGGSVAHGLVSTSIKTVRLITADGTPLDIHRGSALFPHVAVSLGMLGILSTITFECVPRFHLEMIMRVVPFEQYLRDHDAENRAHEFYSASWIPTARRVITFAANRVPAPGRTRRRRERFCCATFLWAALSRRLHLHALPARWFTARAVDAGDRMISPIQNGSRRVQLLRFLTRDWKAAEFAVPLSRAAETLTALDRLIADHRHALTNPVGLRATAADGFSLSPCYGTDTYWIDLFYRERDGFAPALRQLFEGLGARCHWGKHIGLSERHLRRQYPRWDEFRTARAALDPDGVFTNDFTRRFEP